MSKTTCLQIVGITISITLIAIIFVCDSFSETLIKSPKNDYIKIVANLVRIAFQFIILRIQSKAALVYQIMTFSIILRIIFVFNVCLTIPGLDRVFPIFVYCCFDNVAQFLCEIIPETLEHYGYNSLKNIHRIQLVIVVMYCIVIILIASKALYLVFITFVLIWLYTIFYIKSKEINKIIEQLILDEEKRQKQERDRAMFQLHLRSNESHKAIITCEHICLQGKGGMDIDSNAIEEELISMDIERYLE